MRGRGIHGQEPTYCVLSLLFSQSLSHYFEHPSPILTYLFIFYTLTHWPRSSHFFYRLLSSDTFLCFLVLRFNSCLHSSLTTVYMLSSTRSTVTITIYTEQTASMTPSVRRHSVSLPSCFEHTLPFLIHFCATSCKGRRVSFKTKVMFSSLGSAEVAVFTFHPYSLKKLLQTGLLKTVIFHPGATPLSCDTQDCCVSSILFTVRV